MNAVIQAAAILNHINENREPLNQRLYNAYKEPFELSEREFKKIFRLTKDAASQWINVLEPYMTQPRRESALSVPTKVLCALRFFAGGAYQMDVACNKFFSISQASASRCINEVINAANEPDVMREWIKFPQTFQELSNLRNGFIEKHGIPAIGAVDGTHVAIVPPKTTDDAYPEHVYVNRKGFHSINVQLVCDSDFNIMNVNAKFPGSVHDSHIWNTSSVRPAMERIYDLWPDENFHLLGDSGYALRPWLLTPYINPLEDSPEALFNKFMTSARSTIERCNGLLKMRWRCTHKERVLYYCPNTASKIINTCAILHNFALRHNLPPWVPGLDDYYEDFDDDNHLQDIFHGVVVNEYRDNNRAGERVRAGLVNYLIQNQL